MELLYESIQEVNDQFSLHVPREPGARLSGEGSAFDSLGFINFVASVEEKCHQRFGLQLSLTDDIPTHEAASRFESVEHLAAFIYQQAGLAKP